MKLTEENDKFWEVREKENYDNMKKLFSTLNKKEVNELHRLLLKSLIGIQGLYTKMRG